MSAQDDLVSVTALAAGGAGIGRFGDGQVVFVDGALPGDRVRVEVTERRKDFARAKIAGLEEWSPDRIEAPCPLVSQGCGGCGWQHVDPAAAGRLKTDIVLDALRRIGRVRHDVEVLDPVAVAPDAYRTSARLAVRADGSLGYHRRRSAELVGVDHCGVLHPRLDELLGVVSVSGTDTVTLRVGIAGGERLAVVGLGRKPSGDHPPVHIDAPAGVVVVSGPADRARFYEAAGGRMWRVSARSFFQSGPAAAALLSHAVDRAVGDELGPGDVVVDAYSGVGLLGGVVAARSGASVVAVESSRSAVADARANLADLQAEVVHAEVGRWSPSNADVVVADPSRPGLGRPGVGALVATGAARIVLVSCDPASLGRDASLLAAEGYRAMTVQVTDLFPRTPHVEAVTCFVRS